MLAQNIAPKPAALPPAAPPAALQAGNTSGLSFEQFLSDQVAPPEPASPVETAATDAAPADTAPSPSGQPLARRTATQPAKPAAQGHKPEASAKPELKANSVDRTDPAALDESRTAEDRADDALETPDTPETPELREFTQLIGMTPTLPEANAATVRQEAHRSRSPVTAGDDAPAGRSKQAAVNLAGATEAPAGARAGALRADKPAASTTVEAWQSPAQQHGSDLPVAASTQPAASSFATTLAQALPAPGAAIVDMAPADAPPPGVQAPLNSAAFGPELGARVSLLAVDGVQQAELQLNPADMGPVSVQIVVDGGQAQVSFHALQAETRQALEQSLPDLAAALQGQGLTLSGGGVFQQAPQDSNRGKAGQDDGRAATPSRRGTERVDSATPVTASPARRVVGLLDTFA